MPEDKTPTSSKKLLIAGWVLSVLPALMLLSGAVNGFRMAPMVLEGTTHLGYPASIIPVLATIELVCSVLYLVPATAFYGAILLTAYFGGAVASHLRVGEATWPVAIVFAIVVWAGLTLRDRRLRAFLLGR